MPFEFGRGVRLRSVVPAVPASALGAAGLLGAALQECDQRCAGAIGASAAMDNQYEPFLAFGGWDDIAMRESDTGELASFFSHASPAEDDDGSSIASNDDEPVVAQSFPKKTFPNFDDLRASVLSFARLVADNSRYASKVESFPTKWMREMFPNVQGSVKYSGFLYCKCKHAHNCDWKVHYKLQQNGFWVVLETSVWEHNHELDMLSGNVPAASGLVHLKNVSQLALEHKTAIISFLDAGLTVKVIRYKFRAKFPGYELRDIYIHGNVLKPDDIRIPQ